MSHENPYQTQTVDSSTVPSDGKLQGETCLAKASRWPTGLTILVCSYYVCSSLTLPWSNQFWFGEIPILAIFQLPKAILKSLMQTQLLSLLHQLGWTYGSASPDYAATHRWALGIAIIAPAVITTVLFCWSSRHKSPWPAIGYLWGFAMWDAAVTFWFDHSASLKLFGGSYF